MKSVQALVLGLLLQHLAVAEDGVHRRAQFVAHVRQELRLGAVGGLGGLFGRRSSSSACLRSMPSAMPSATEARACRSPPSVAGGRTSPSRRAAGPRRSTGGPRTTTMPSRLAHSWSLTRGSSQTALVRWGRRSWAIRPILNSPTGTRPCGPSRWVYRPALAWSSRTLPFLGQASRCGRRRRPGAAPSPRRSAAGSPASPPSGSGRRPPPRPAPPGAPSGPASPPPACCSVMSRTNALKDTPPGDCIGTIASSIGNSVPSRRRAAISIRWFSTGPSPVSR